MRDILIHRDTQFNKALAGLKRAGGTAAAAADEVDRIIGRARGSEDELPEVFGKLTKHGESRIKHCWKYDLPGAHRLVTRQDGAAIWLLFVGDHTSTDRWIEAHRGMDFIIDDKTKKLVRVHQWEVGEPLPQRPRPPLLDVETPLLDKLSEAVLDLLELPVSLTRKVGKLTAASDDDDLLAAVRGVPEQTLSLVLDVLLQLREGNLAGAEACVRRSKGLARAAEEPGALDEALASGNNIDTVLNLRDLSDEELGAALGRREFTDWLLFLHPDQRAVVKHTFDGPTVLRGVSGSGKTCVVVHRAWHLATRYEPERVLVLTLNPALAGLISTLLDLLCGTEQKVRRRIDVLSVPELCRRLISQYQPDQWVQERDARSGETQEDSFWDSFEKPEQQELLAPIMKSLEATHGVVPSRYIQDEFTWIRSALLNYQPAAVGYSIIPERALYTNPVATPRTGRSIAFSADWRQRMLGALTYYEDHLSAGRFADDADLALRAHATLSYLRGEREAFRYRCVLVDEFQDLGTVELDIIRALAPTEVDGLFVAGDYEQQVFPKDHSLRVAQAVPAHRRYFRKNYRNTRQILEAGATLVRTFGVSPGEEASEAAILAPEFSVRESAPPLVVSCEDETDELAFILQYLELRGSRNCLPVAVVACGLRVDQEGALEELQGRYRDVGLPVELLGPQTKLASGAVFLSGLEAIKGFEFSLVVVSQCGANEMPSPAQPKEEQWRDARRLYVALTRARDEVVITHSGKPSSFLEGIRTFVRWSSTKAQFPLAGGPAPELPRDEPPAPEVAAEVRSLAPPVQSTRTDTTAGKPVAIETVLMEVAAGMGRSLEIVDKRSRGGCLWVVGGKELAGLMTAVERVGFRFAYTPTGSASTKRRPGWYCKQ